MLTMGTALELCPTRAHFCSLLLRHAEVRVRSPLSTSLGPDVFRMQISFLCFRKAEYTMPYAYLSCVITSLATLEVAPYNQIH